MKRYLGVFLALVLLLVGLAAVASAEYISSTMLDYEDGSYYLVETATGKKIDFTGWREETFMWEDEEDGYISTWTVWLYGEGKGKLAYGWKQIGGKWYYFSDWGWMYNDGLYWINEKFYAFEKSGTMKANKWHSESWTYEDGTKEVHWLYMGADGAAKTGWFKVGKDWYYADEDGWMWTGPLQDGDDMYYLKDTGEMAANEWIQNGGDWFYYKANGAKAENEWIQDGSAWYYLGEEGAMYHSGTYTINGKEYKFADNGVWIP